MGKRLKKRGHASEKAGEARGDAAEQMEKSGNKVEKADGPRVIHRRATATVTAANRAASRRRAPGT
jgi:hypothetical protein